MYSASDQEVGHGAIMACPTTVAGHLVHMIETVTRTPPTTAQRTMKQGGGLAHVLMPISMVNVMQSLPLLGYGGTVLARRSKKLR